MDDMRLNDNVEGPAIGVVDSMSVVVSGGNAATRLAVKNVIFNALEGSRFREVEYVSEITPQGCVLAAIPDDGGPPMQINEPVEDAESLLQVIVRTNPLLFHTPIKIESHQSLLESGQSPIDARWHNRVERNSELISSHQLEAIDRVRNTFEAKGDPNAGWERAQQPPKQGVADILNRASSITIDGKITIGL